MTVVVGRYFFHRITKELKIVYAYESADGYSGNPLWWEWLPRRSNEPTPRCIDVTWNNTVPMAPPRALRPKLVPPPAAPPEPRLTSRMITNELLRRFKQNLETIEPATPAPRPVLVIKPKPEPIPPPEPPPAPAEPERMKPGPVKRYLDVRRESEWQGNLVRIAGQRVLRTIREKFPDLSFSEMEQGVSPGVLFRHS